MDHYKKISKLVLFLFLFSHQAGHCKDACLEFWEDIVDEEGIEEKYRPLINTCGPVFRQKLKALISTNRNANYYRSRFFMFSILDNIDGRVCSVYSEDCVETDSIPSGVVMNCEHSWPQSHGAASAIPRSDLHHLFPVMAPMNSRRGNYPYCEVSDSTPYFTVGVLGRSEYGTKCFEPPDSHKGDVARAMFYFAVRYGHQLDHEQESFLRAWSKEDPVSQKEVSRNDRIEEFQSNRNPFVDHPLFVGLIQDF